MVGDRLDTDVAFANALTPEGSESGEGGDLSLTSALVLTGVSTLEQAEAARSPGADRATRPDLVFDSLADLVDAAAIAAVAGSSMPQ